MLAVRAVALVGLLCVNVLPVAAAAPDPTAQTDRFSATISVADLDLSTPEGERAVRERVRKAAIALCRRFSDTRRVSDRETMADCVRQAVASALVRGPNTHSR